MSDLEEVKIRGRRGQKRKASRLPAEYDDEDGDEENTNQTAVQMWQSLGSRSSRVTEEEDNEDALLGPPHSAVVLAYMQSRLIFLVEAASAGNKVIQGVWGQQTLGLNPGEACILALDESQMEESSLLTVSLLEQFLKLIFNKDEEPQDQQVHNKLLAVYHLLVGAIAQRFSTTPSCADLYSIVFASACFLSLNRMLWLAASDKKNTLLTVQQCARSEYFAPDQDHRWRGNKIVDIDLAPEYLIETHYRGRSPGQRSGVHRRTVENADCIDDPLFHVTTDQVRRVWLHRLGDLQRKPELVHASLGSLVEDVIQCVEHNLSVPS